MTDERVDLGIRSIEAVQLVDGSLPPQLPAQGSGHEISSASGVAAADLRVELRDELVWQAYRDLDCHPEMVPSWGSQASDRCL